MQKSNRKKNINVKKLIKLFCTSLTISALAFGGGFVVLSLQNKTYVQKLKWVTEQEMIDLSSLAQASPGAIAVNVALLIGYKMAGIIGAILTVIASIIPPFLIITALYYFFDAVSEYVVMQKIIFGMQAGVSGVLISLAIDSIKGATKGAGTFGTIILILSFLISTICNMFLSLNCVPYLIILSGIPHVETVMCLAPIARAF
jgi:chromate transporter